MVLAYSFIQNREWVASREVLRFTLIFSSPISHTRKQAKPMRDTSTVRETITDGSGPDDAQTTKQRSVKNKTVTHKSPAISLSKNSTGTAPNTSDATRSDRTSSDTQHKALAVTEVLNLTKAVHVPAELPGSNFSHTNKTFDYLVVGAGFAGSVLAERLATQLNKRVLIVDKYPHIGGNAYDHYDEAGILVHKYGPHIFHTNSARAFNYLSQFTSWRTYQHRVLASVDGQMVPMPINLDTLNRLYGMSLTFLRGTEVPGIAGRAHGRMRHFRRRSRQ